MASSKPSASGALAGTPVLGLWAHQRLDLLSRKRIQELQEYRRLGIRTLGEAQLYDEERRSALAAMRSSGEVDAGPGTRVVAAAAAAAATTRQDGSTRYILQRSEEWERLHKQKTGA